MADLVFPSSPAAGDLFPDPAIAGVSQWRWDGNRWLLVSPGGGGAGSNVTISPTPPPAPDPGALWWSLDESKLYMWDGAQWLLTGGDFVTQEQLDNAVGDTAASLGNRQNRNRIINGDMARNQYHGTQDVAWNPASNWILDRWIAGFTTQNVFVSTGYGTRSVLRGVNRPSGAGSALQIVNANPQPLSPSSGFNIAQLIEVYNCLDFEWGTPGGLPVTLSFWFWALLPGVYSGSLCNWDGTRSFPFTFTQAAASQWTFHAVTIPADTTGNWDMQQAEAAVKAGVTLRFDMGSGSNYAGPAGQWQNGLITRASEQTVNLSQDAPAGPACACITNVQLELGAQASPYDWKSVAQTYLDICRYYFNPGGVPIAVPCASSAYAAGDSTYASWAAPVTMAKTPDINAHWTNLWNATPTPSYALDDRRTIFSGLTALGPGSFFGTWNIQSLNAELVI